jgi:catechol 2,3-dioxygenase-like lactoylglutathione lyase family enzyme
MLAHISLGVSDLLRTIAFYDAVLAPLGYARLWTSEHGAGYGISGPDEPLAFFATGAAAKAPGAGCHVALTAPSADAVRRFHLAACALGATDEGAPGPRPRYGAGYYAAFIRDLDGYRIEAVWHGAASEDETPRADAEPS